MTITRREFAKASAIGLGGLALAFSASAEEPREGKDRKPNVVYVFSDQHRYQSMSFTEMPEVKTPNMARLAKQGVCFDNCISNYPLCSPHRAMLLTGRWPYQQKMLDDSPGMIDNNLALDPDQMTVGKAFKHAGYATGYIGKWHLTGTDAVPFGFDHSQIWENDNDHWNAYYFENGERIVPAPQGYNATLMMNQALEFIEEKHAAPDPFFLMLSLNPPHLIFNDATQERKDLYPNESDLPRRPNFPKAYPQPFENMTWETYQGYHAHVSAIDEELGRIMAKLDELGLADNTIVVYTADHGSMLGSHAKGDKRHPYQEAIKVPFIARWPKGIPTGRRSDLLLGTIDIMPTLCGLAGLPIPKVCQGQDLSPSFRGEKSVEPESQFIMHICADANDGEKPWAPYFRGVTTGRYTYTVHAGELGQGTWQLFDNEVDPYQMNNLAEDTSMAPVKKELVAMLADWLKQSDDPYVLPEELHVGEQQEAQG